MALFNIADETRPSRTAQVFSNKAVRTSGAWTQSSLASGTATGVIAAAAGILHSIIFTNSATAGALLTLTDSATVALGVGDNSASAIGNTWEPVAGRTTYILDAIFNNGLCYRLSAQNCSGIVITYSVAS